MEEPAFSFDLTAQVWNTGAPVRPAPALSALRCLTYNVWFGKHQFERRCSAMLRILKQSDADIIALQEVTPPFLQRLLAEPWVQQGYTLSDVTGETLDPYGVLLLLRYTPRALSLYPLPSLMDRALLVAELMVNGEPLLVGTVHLESRRPSAPTRAKQLRMILPVMDDAPHALLMGDFNFCSSWPENQQLPERYLDLWPALQGKRPGYTEDTQINLMRLRATGKPKLVRFDRILLRSRQPGWAATQIELLGTRPVAPELPAVFPSDHFGLAATIAWHSSSEF